MNIFIKKIVCMCDIYQKEAFKALYFIVLDRKFMKKIHNMWLTNTHILICQYARCDFKLWNAPWFYCVFCVFSYIFDDHYSCLNYCIFTKHSQIVFWLMYTFWFVNLPNMTAGYGRFSDLIVFFGEFSYIWTSLKSYTFIKLLQILC